MAQIPQAPLGENPPQGPQGYYEDPKTPTLAVAALVLGILGFCSFGVLGIFGIIFGHITYSEISKSRGRLTGGGMALAGLITGYVSIAVTILLVVLPMMLGLAIALPIFGEVQDRNNQTGVLAQGKQIGMACLIYAGDHQGKFPAKLEELVPNYLPELENLECRYPDPNIPSKFVYFGGSTSDPNTKVLLASPKVPNKGRVYISVDGSGLVKTRTQLRKEGDPVE